MVYVPYCSSDAHMGDSEHEVIGLSAELNVFAFLISINVNMQIQRHSRAICEDR